MFPGRLASLTRVTDPATASHRAYEAVVKLTRTASVQTPKSQRSRGSGPGADCLLSTGRGASRPPQQPRARQEGWQQQGHSETPHSQAQMLSRGPEAPAVTSPTHEVIVQGLCLSKTSGDALSRKPRMTLSRLGGLGRPPAGADWGPQAREGSPEGRPPAPWPFKRRVPGKRREPLRWPSSPPTGHSRSPEPGFGWDGGHLREKVGGDL